MIGRVIVFGIAFNNSQIWSYGEAVSLIPKNSIVIRGMRSWFLLKLRQICFQSLEQKVYDRPSLKFLSRRLKKQQIGKGSSMNNMGGLIFGMIAGMIGAAIWAAIAYFGNVEIGWVAWGIGAFIGVAVSAGSREKGMLPAMIAVIITVASLCAGKYATIALLMGDVPQVEYSEELVIQEYAFGLAQEREDAGEHLIWRNGTNFDTAQDIDDIPRDVVDQARLGFPLLSEEDQETMRGLVKQMVEQRKNGGLALQAFMASFNGFDLLFFGLGIFTAAKLAYADVIDEDETQ